MDRGAWGATVHDLCNDLHFLLDIHHRATFCFNLDCFSFVSAVQISYRNFFLFLINSSVSMNPYRLSFFGSLFLFCWTISSNNFFHKSYGKKEGAVLRWWRNRTGRPLSPSQIPQKNISTLSKLHKTTSECWQRTSGTQKSRSLSSKTSRKKYKRRKKRQRRWGGSSILGREACPWKGILRREVSKHQETLSLPSLWRALETQRAT